MKHRAYSTYLSLTLDMKVEPLDYLFQFQSNELDGGKRHKGAEVLFE